MGLFNKSQGKTVATTDDSPDRAPAERHSSHAVPLESVEKSRWERSWPVIACGAGLFSGKNRKDNAILHVH